MEYETSLGEIRAQKQKLQEEVKELNLKIESKEMEYKSNEQKLEEVGYYFWFLSVIHDSNP